MKTRWIPLLVVMIAGLAFAWWWHSRESQGLGESAYEQTRAILAKGPRPPQSKALDEVRAHVATQLRASGWATRAEAFERQTPKGMIRFENLRARFVVGEADPWERRVDGLLCAHIDSKLYEDKVFLGADDAASACAAIVVMAEFLAKKKPDQAAALELVFFDGEEALEENITPWDGLYGSRHYANFWRARDDKPKWGILLDMIGHKDLSIRLPSDTPKDWKDLVFAAAKSEGEEVYFGMAATPIIDDHMPLNSVGIPTVDLIGDFTRRAWWHTAGDKMNIISAESLDISMRVTLRMIDMRLGK
ncbi:MAG: M28 family peptidase [Luteolibacter sp.]